MSAGGSNPRIEWIPSDHRLIACVHLPEAAPFELPFGGAAFPCLIWDDRGEPPDQLARCLVAANCRYFVCGGRFAEAWHDAADHAYVEATLDLSEEEATARHLMTVGTADETVEEVASFFRQCTDFGPYAFDRGLLLTFGAVDARIEAVRAALVT